MNNLTEKETAMIVAFIEEGRDVNSAETPDALIEDNMTWMNADDLCGALGWNKQEVGGVMSALSDKGMIFDSGDSPRGSRVTDWNASNDAIREFFHLTEGR